MKSAEIRKKFLEFFEQRGHKIVPSSSLVPKDDPSVLFTTAGMQQFKSYYIGKKDAKRDFGTLNTASSQKSLRTSDIEEVGDESHLTFFEMLGNFSFGGYFKKEAIEYAHEFITEELGLKIDYVSVFSGDRDVPEDKKSYEIWKLIGIPEDKIKKFDKDDNFWGPIGDEGPCGPTVEIYINGIEIWNIVFIEYYCHKDGKLEPLKQKGVDTGMGLERLAVVAQKKNNVFDTDLFESLMDEIKELSDVDNEKARRIVADHIRAAVFMIADGVVPSNTEQGYILRRLIRRAVRYADILGIKKGKLSELTDVIGEIYKDIYTDILQNIGIIKDEILIEEEKFRKTLKRGIKILNTELSAQIFTSGEPVKVIDVSDGFTPENDFNLAGKFFFDLYQNHGFPLEMSIEEIERRGRHLDQVVKDRITEEFKKKMKKHQEVSKAGVEKKFKGGLAGHGEMEIQYHTATHLLHQALREVLGNHVLQKGSNITTERLRFDFSHTEKMTDGEKKKVEDLVNEKIKESLLVSFEEVSLEEAKDRGALGVFGEKYGDKIKIYQIGEGDTMFSLEICGGPHVNNTSELGHFKIKKEGAVAAGVRRIKAILE